MSGRNIRITHEIQLVKPKSTGKIKSNSHPVFINIKVSKKTKTKAPFLKGVCLNDSEYKAVITRVANSLREDMIYNIVNDSQYFEKIASDIMNKVHESDNEI